MAKKKTLTAQTDDLRQRAEEMVGNKEASTLEPLSHDQMQRILHELRVYQIELEMQNEELLRTQHELESLRERYFDMFDLAPFNYLTLNEQGLILETNLSAASVLGVERGTLLKQPLSHYIHPDDQDILYLHCKQLSKTYTPKTCEFRMLKMDGTQFWARMETAPGRDKDSGKAVFLTIFSDIIERKQTEEALQKSENQYRTILHTLLDGFWVVDMQGRFIDVNEAYCKIIGYTRDEMLKMSIQDVEALENKEDIEHRIQKIIINGSHRFESQHRCKDGHIVDLDICVSKLPDTGRLCASLRDITEQKKTAKSLKKAHEGLEMRVAERTSELAHAIEQIRDSEERLHFALENSHTGAWEMNLVDHTAFHSIEHARIFGYQEVVPKWSYEMFLEHVLLEDRAIIDGKIRQSIENRNNWSFECRIRRTDGQIRWIQTSGRHLHNAEGVPLRAAGIIQDITYRKRVEEEIIQLNTDLEKRVAGRTADFAHANELLRMEIADRQQVENSLRLANEEWLNTFNASSDPIFLLDTDHHIMRANKALAAMVGLPVEDIIGRLCYEIIHCSDAPVTPCPQCMLLEDYQSHTEEIFLEKLGRYLLVTVSPIFDSGDNLVGSIHYSKDITTLKAAEQALANAKSDLERKVTERTSELAQAHEQMKRVSFQLIWAEEKERERIAAELHDQVGQALLLAKMKLDALEDKLSDDSLHTYAMEAASLIGTSIQDIRSLTFRMRPPILDTAGIETALEWLCSSISNDYNLQVDFVDNCQPKPLLSAEVRYSLYQAVRELLLNVVKHAGTELAHVSITCENQMLVVQVADNGFGFNHPDAIMKHVHNGGYGLYNVRQRIEQMDGRFAVESTPGQGTSVTLMVPLSES